MSTDSPGPRDPDQNIGPGLITFIWTFTTIAGIVLALRLFAVFHVLHRARAADYTMIASFILAVIGGAFLTKACRWGLGRHSYYLSPEQMMNELKYTILYAGSILMSLMLGRISFCFFLLSIIGVDKYTRLLLWAVIIIQLLVNISSTILTITRCGSHVTALWDIRVHAKCLPFKVLIDFLYFLSAVNTLTDLFLAILPAVLLKGLNMNIKKKIIVMILLCLSTMKLLMGTGALVKLNYWIMAETYTIIIVASIPLMNSLVKWGREIITSRSYGASMTRSQNQVTIQQTWTVEHEEANDAKQINGIGLPSDRESKESV